MKIALVYTGVTPQLTAMVEAEVKKQLGSGPEIVSYQDPSIIKEVSAANYVTRNAAARLVKMYMTAVEAQADAILNVCSSVGDVADAAQPLARLTGVPIVRIDDEMCREAVRRGSKIAVMATLQSTLVPTKNTVLRAAQEFGKRVELVDVLVEGGFGMDEKQFLELMTRFAKGVMDKVDVLLFAQGSMAYAEESIKAATGKLVLSSPRFGALALRQALEAKGLV